MKTIKLFLKVRWLVVTCLMLLTISPQVWGAGTAISSLNFNAPTSLPSNYTYSSTNTPDIQTFESISCVQVSPSGNSNAPTTWSATDAAVPSGGKRWLAFQPAVDCRVTIKVASGSKTKTFYLLDKDHNTTSSYVSSFTTTAASTWYTDWSASLTNSTWYAIMANASKCYIASMQFVANPTYSETAGTELTQNSGTVTLTSSGTTIYYKWSTSSNAYAANAGASLVSAADGSGSSPKTVPAPDGTGTYYLYAVAKSGNYYSDVVKRNFTIVAGGGGCSAPDAPTIGGTTSYTAGGTISLNATCSSGADASTTYTWYKGNTWESKSQVQAAATSASGGTTYSKSAVVADDGTYWCEASNGSGCEAHNSTGYTITVSCATAPSAVTSLTCSAQTSSSLTYTWTKASNASGYVATIYTNAACTTQVATQNLGDVATVTFSTLSASTTYYCKVQSKGNGTVYCEDGGTTSAESGTTLAPTYTVTAATSTGDNSRGTVSAGVSSLAEDGTTTITAVPATGYQVSNWAVSGTGASISPSGSSSSTTTTLTMGTANTTVTVTFSAINYDVTYSAPTNGNYTISVAGGSATSASKTATIGQTITLAATPSSGYVLSSWTVSKESGGTVTVSNNQFTMPADNVTITATFARVYTVTYSAGASATCKASDTQASLGANITLATPTWSSHTFLGWYVGDTKIGNAGATYAPTADITVYGAWKEDCAGGSAEVWFSSSNKNDADEYFAAMSTSSNTTQLVGSGVAKLIAVGSSDLQADPSNKKVGYRLDSRLNIVFKFDATTSLDIYLTNGGSSGRTCQLASFSSDKALSNIGTSDYSSKTTVTSNVSATGAVVSTVAAGSATVSSGVITITGSGGLKISYTSLAAGYYVFYSTSSSSMYVSGFEESAGSGTCYYVTYDGNGADGGLTCDPTAYAANEDLEVLDNGDGGSAYTKAGYTFTGWNTLANGTGTPYAAGGTITDISDNVTLHAQWVSGTTYTLTASATVINPMTADSKTGAITATISDSPVTGIISGTTTSTSSNTFTVAKATPVTVTAPLTVDGSTEECDECTYRFDSWENIPASVTADVSNIHAKYNTTYSLSYNLDDGDWADAYSAPTYYIYGTGATLPVAANVEKEGYAFVGWTNDDGGASITEADDETWGNISVTAHWSATGYNITYDCDGADSGCPSDQTNKTKLPNPLPSAPVKDGYAFVGWYTNSTKTDAAVAGATLEDDVTLYAKWAALHSVTVTYGSGGSAASAASASVGEGLTTTISATPATGYNFSAWEFTSNTGSATLDNAANNPATLTMGTANVTVNATFSALSYTVTLNTNGGTINAGNVTSYTYGVGATLPTNVTRSNYVFGGWYEDSGFAGERIYTISTTATGNKTYYAKWTYDYPSGYIYITDVMATAEAPATGVSTSNSSYTYDGTLSGSFTHTGYARWLLSSASINYTITFGTPLDISSYEGGVEVIAWWGVNTGSNNQLTLNVNSTDVGSQKPSGSSEQYKLLTLTSSAITSSSINSIVLKASSSNVALFRVAIREIPVYPVTYKANGSGESDVEHNVNVVEDNMFTRNGYTFTGWNTENDGSGDPYSVGAEVTEELTLYAQWTCTTPTYGTNLSTTPYEVEQGDDAVTLTVAASANSGTVTYQWYSNTSKSTAGATTLTTGASYNAPTSSVGTLYYYCIATNSTADCSTTVQSNYATVVVSEPPCFKFSCESQSSKISAISSESEITTSSWEDGKATLTGGTMTNGSSSLNVNKTYGLVMESGKEVTVTLGGDYALAVGSVITLKAGVSDASGSQTSGLVVSGNTCSPASYTSSTAGAAFTQTYTVTALDGLAGTKSFTIAMKSDLTKTYLNGITVTGCVECTPIDPELTAGTTKLYVYPTITSTTLTLDKDGSTGTVTWESSNTDVATVSGSGTSATVTAVAVGSATIKASIAEDGTHCAKSVTQTFTVTGGCGNDVVAGATRTSGATTVASSEGELYGEAVFNTDNTGKISGGKYVYLELTSGNYFQNGDIVVVTITNKSDQGTKELNVCAGSTSPGTCVGVLAAANVKENDDNEVVLSNVPENTSTITIHRTGNSTTQNHYVDAIKVKRYVCPQGVKEFDAASNSNWGTTGNWIGTTGHGASLPAITDRAIIKKPVVVNIANAKANDVIIDQASPNTGKLEIEAAKALVVAETVKKYNGSSVVATDYSDINIHSSASGTGALVMGSHDGTNKATVEFYSLGRKNNEGKKVYQYIGTPFNDVADAQYNYYGSWMYRWNAGSYSWTKMSNGMPVVAFMGYSIAQPSTDSRTYWMQGTLVSSDNVAKPLLRHSEGGGKPYENMFANSWMAPISLAAMESSDFGGADATIYIFNAGSDAQNQAAGGGMAGSQTEANPGQYTTAPIKTSGWMDEEGNQLTVIPSMQAFSVLAPDAGDATLTLNYSKHVLTPALTSVSIQPNRAPGRRNAASSRPPMLRLFVNGESFGDQLWMFMRNDFSEGFDNGYDGRKLVGDSKAPQLYATTTDGNMTIHCTPEADGTMLGFHPGQDASYTFSFIYDGDETLYLNDLKTETSTLIREGNTYNFTYEDGDAVNRFMISATPFAKTTPTGIEDGSLQKVDGVQKVIYKDHMYIIRGGRVFDATGAIVK